MKASGKKAPARPDLRADIGQAQAFVSEIAEDLQIALRCKEPADLDLNIGEALAHAEKLLQTLKDIQLEGES